MSRRPSLRSTLDALSDAFVDAVLLAVRRAVLTRLAGAFDRPMLAEGPLPTRKAGRARSRRQPKVTSPSDSRSSPRPRRTSPAAPVRRHVELPLDLPEYPETVIIDPDAILRALSTSAPIRAIEEPVAHGTALTPAATPRQQPSRPARRTRSALVLADAPPADSRATTASQPAPDPIPRAGEELLRGTGGGAVLRRRRASPSSPTPAG
jgi:hypothetical protein